MDDINEAIDSLDDVYQNILYDAISEIQIPRMQITFRFYWNCKK